MPGFGTLRQTKVGKLRQRPRLERAVAADPPTDGRGQPVFTWELVGIVPAGIRGIGGREAERAHQLAPSATHQFTIRHHPSIAVEMRFVLRERVFYIGYVANLDESDRFMQVLVAEDLSP